MPLDSLPSGCVAECSGCAHRLMTMDESISQKKLFLMKKLANWNELIEEVRTVPSHNRLNYRDKVNLAMRWNGFVWETGTLKRDELIPIPNCPVQKAYVNEIIGLFNTSLPQYSEIHAVRYVQTAKQVTLVVKSRDLPNFNQWLDASFTEKLASLGIEGLWLHLFPSSGKKVFGKGGWHLIWGKEVSQDESGLWYGPATFQQLLPSLASEALETSFNFLKPNSASALIEMYCGTGMGLRKWTQSDAKVLGIEISAEALRLAALNAPEAITLTGSCRHRLPQMEEWLLDNKAEERLLYVNPPRTGLEDGIADWITSFMKPLRMAYLSCSAGTLNRDLSILCRSGYSVEKIIPFDFFPQTIHIESLVLLSRI